MAVLSNGMVENLDSETGAATLRVTSDTAGETLYVAVRTSGPYGPTDQEVIKNSQVGVDSCVYADSTISVASDQNIFTATGLPAVGPLYCGFAQESAAVVGELHLTLTGTDSVPISAAATSPRLGDYIAELADGSMARIPTSNPVKLLFFGGTWDGTKFSGADGVVGVDSVNCRLLWNDDLTNPVWVRGGDLAVPVRHGTILDPLGEQGAWHLTSASGTGTLTQTWTNPTGYNYASVWARTVSGSGTINLGRQNGFSGPDSSSFTVDTQWRHCGLVSNGSETDFYCVDFNGSSVNEILVFCPVQTNGFNRVPPTFSSGTLRNTDNVGAQISYSEISGKSDLVNNFSLFYEVRVFNAGAGRQAPFYNFSGFNSSNASVFDFGRTDPFTWVSGRIFSPGFYGINTNQTAHSRGDVVSVFMRKSSVTGVDLWMRVNGGAWNGPSAYPDITGDLSAPLDKISISNLADIGTYDVLKRVDVWPTPMTPTEAGL